jgi:predicted amidohydrolase
VATQAGRTVDEDFPGGGYLFDDHGQVVAQTADWSEGLLMVDIQM